MLDYFTVEAFAPRIGETFRLLLEDRPTIDVVLVKAAEMPLPGWQTDGFARRRQPYVLQFVGPSDDSVQQGIHRLEHDDLRVLEIFLAPVDRSDDGVIYEAVFS
jgi:hypothetical protein